MPLVRGIDQEFWGLSSVATVYEQARTVADFDDCMDLIGAQGWPTDYQLEHPTIVAKRDGDIIGVLGTRRPNGIMLAGPLAVLDPPKPLLVYKLILFYSAVCIRLGVDFVLFDVDVGSPMERAILKMWPDIPLVSDRGDIRVYRWNMGS